MTQELPPLTIVNRLQKIKNFLKKRPKTYLALTIIAIFIVYLTYHKLFPATIITNYTLGQVEKGTIITSVSGSGQVSNSNQIDLKAKVSGDIAIFNLQAGKTVKANDLLLQLNAQDAQKTVRDALANLESAQISLSKLKQPADTLSLTQAQNSLAQAQENKQNIQDDLQKTYDDGFNSIANAFLDLPTIITGLHDILYGTTAGNAGQDNASYFHDVVKTYDYSDTKVTDYKNATIESYLIAREKYDQNFNNYKLTSRFASHETIENLINESYDTTKNLADAIKNAYNFIQYYEDKVAAQNKRPSSVADNALNSLTNYTSKTNNHLANLLSAQKTIQNYLASLVDADRTIAEQTESLNKLQAGADELDIQSQQLTIKQRQNSLADAREKLADYYVRAPFDGTIAQVNIKKTDTISANTTIATLVTPQQIAEISLNEVDVAKVAVGQKATLTFDAVEDLTITGTIINLDTLGTVSQGVVTYTAQIAFDTQDDRVKSGMSVNAVIMTTVKPDVLLVPASAVKQQNSIYYVEVFENLPANITSNQTFASETPPQRKTVTIGLSNDNQTEIISGLNENDLIVSRTTASTATTPTSNTQQAPSLFGTTPGGSAMRR